MATSSASMAEDIKLAKELQAYINGLNLQSSNRFDGMGIYENHELHFSCGTIKDYVAKFAIKNPIIAQYYKECIGQIKATVCPSYIEKYQEYKNGFVIHAQIKDHFLVAYREDFMSRLEALSQTASQELLRKFRLKKDSIQSKCIYSFIEKYMKIHIDSTIAKTLKVGNSGELVSVAMEFLLKKSNEGSSVFKSNSFKVLLFPALHYPNDLYVLLQINDKICYDPWTNQIFHSMELARKIPVGYTMTGQTSDKNRTFMLADESIFKLFSFKNCKEIMDKISAVCNAEMSDFIQNIGASVSMVMQEVERDIDSCKKLPEDQDFVLAKELQAYINGLNLPSSNRVEGKSVYADPEMHSRMLDLKQYILKFALNDSTVEKYQKDFIEKQGVDLTEAFQVIKATRYPVHFKGYARDFIYTHIKNVFMESYRHEFMGQLEKIIPKLTEKLLAKFCIKNKTKYESMVNFIRKCGTIYIDATLSKTANVVSCVSLGSLSMEYLLKKINEPMGVSVFHENEFVALGLPAAENGDHHLLLQINGRVCFDPWENKVFLADELGKHIPVGYKAVELFSDFNRTFLNDDESVFRLFSEKEYKEMIGEVYKACDALMSNFIQNIDTLASEVLFETEKGPSWAESELHCCSLEEFRKTVNKKDVNIKHPLSRNRVIGTLLHEKCLEKDVDIQFISILLANGADPNEKAGYFTCLDYAVGEGRIDIVKLFMQNSVVPIQPETWKKAMGMYSVKGELEDEIDLRPSAEIRKLLQQGLANSECSSKSLQQRCGKEEDMKHDKDKLPPVYRPSLKASTAKQQLENFKNEVQKDGVDTQLPLAGGMGTRLHFTCLQKGVDKEFIAILLAAGANPNAELMVADNKLTCLDLALVQDRPEIIKPFVQNTAVPVTTENWQKAIGMWIMEHSLEDEIGKLLQEGLENSMKKMKPCQSLK